MIASSVTTGIPWIPEPTRLDQTMPGSSSETRSLRNGARAAFPRYVGQ